MPGNALVISGGTAKGAYAAGLVHGLFSRQEDLRHRVRTFSGTSTGSLIVPMLALYAATGVRDYLDRIPERYMVDSREVWVADPQGLSGKLVAFFARPLMDRYANLIGNIVERGSGLDTEPLRRMIAREYTDDLLEELFRHRDRVEAIVNCVSAQSGRVETFSSADRAIVPEIFRSAIYASCLQPIFMPLCTIDHPRHGPQQYMDGGVRDVIPIRAAWNAGASRVLAIALSDRETPVQKERYEGFASVPRLLLRVLVGLLDQEVADDDIHEARYIATIGRLARFAPPEELHRALELIDPKERPRFCGEHPLHDLYVHRPDPAVKLSDDFEWTRRQMEEWILAGKKAAEGAEGLRMEAFLRGGSSLASASVGLQP